MMLLWAKIWLHQLKIMSFVFYIIFPPSRYILGVNTESKEIAMTRPVLSSVVAKENNLMDLEMCFWLGTPYETKFESAGLGKIMYNLQQVSCQILMKLIIFHIFQKKRILSNLCFRHLNRLTKL